MAVSLSFDEPKLSVNPTQIIDVLGTVIGQLDDVAKAIPAQIPVPNLVLDIPEEPEPPKYQQEDFTGTACVNGEEFKFKVKDFSLQVDHNSIGYYDGPSSKSITLSGIITS